MHIRNAFTDERINIRTIKESQSVIQRNTDFFGKPANDPGIFLLKEDIPTLLMFDVVDLDKPVQAELPEEIRKDGVAIYEKV